MANYPFPIRKIIHVDMDAFYASVEQLDNPALRGKALVVGGNEERGVISAASYEARKYGVRSAMPGSIAIRKCAHLIFVPPRFERYAEISKEIHRVFAQFTDLFEPLSLDEAFLDVSENKMSFPSATLIAQEIRRRILLEIGLTASAGISVNKFVAKVASDFNKPNGQLTVPPEEVIPFIEKLPIGKFFGVGKVTADKMQRMGIQNGMDLKKQSLESLLRNFGKSGQFYFDIARGVQHSLVIPNRERKSIAAERTFTEDIQSRQKIKESLIHITELLETRMLKNDSHGKTITLKFKYNDFSLHTRSRTFQESMQTKEDFLPPVLQLFEEIEFEKPIRLLGISITKLNEVEQVKKDIQFTLEF